MEHLCIPDGLNGVISDIPVPDNLTLTVSSDENRDYALIQLLQEQKFVDFQSIIVYCSRRDQCERVAKNLRTYFQVIFAFCVRARKWRVLAEVGRAIFTSLTINVCSCLP